MEKSCYLPNIKNWTSSIASSDNKSTVCFEKCETYEYDTEVTYSPISADYWEKNLGHLVPSSTNDQSLVEDFVRYVLEEYRSRCFRGPGITCYLVCVLKVYQLYIYSIWNKS